MSNSMICFYSPEKIDSRLPVSLSILDKDSIASGWISLHIKWNYRQGDFNETKSFNSSLSIGDYTIDAVVIEKGSYDSIIVPSSISALFFSEDNSIKELIFEGNLPHIGDSGRPKIESLRINAPINDVILPLKLKDSLIDAVYDESTRRYLDGSIVYAAPGFCNEESIVPGFIKATARVNERFIDRFYKEDRVVEINSRYIAAVEPLKLNTFTPSIGSIIHIVTQGIEKHFDYIVYEPQELILEKILSTRKRMDAEMLYQQIKELFLK